jgi:2-methylfumaryl-CoA isomerase
MVVALTGRQWRALTAATGIEAGCMLLERATEHDLDTASGRFAARDQIAALLRPWFTDRTLEQVRCKFAHTGVSWGPCQTFRQLVTEDPRASRANAMLEDVEHPGVASYLMPRSPLDFGAAARVPVRRAPLLGEHTEEILSGVLGLDGAEIARLFDKGVVAGASRTRR